MDENGRERAPRRFVKGRELSFLLRELALWRAASIIDAEQAAAIEELYAPRKGRVSQILLGLGGMLVGLGFLSAVAANWLDMPRALRAALIVLCYLFALFAAWRTEEGLPRTSRALLLLGDRTSGFALVLTTMLVFSGIGAMWAGRAAAPARALRVAVLVALCCSALALLGVRPAVLAALDLPWMVRVALLVVALAPISLALGFPFPLGLDRFQQEGPALLPWAWALNGAFSVVATPLWQRMHCASSSRFCGRNAPPASSM